MNPLTLDSPVIDPTGLTPRQLAGDACVLCRKPWPRTLIGQFPSGEAALACDDHDFAGLLADAGVSAR
jgi:hypothetical protein